MRYKLVIPNDIALRLRALSPSFKRQIRNALDAISEDPHIGIPLRDKLKGFRKYRVSRYRIVYEIFHRTVEVHIVEIGRRELIYDILLKRFEK